MFKSRFTTQSLTRTALLISISVVIKLFLSLDSAVYAIRFFELPLIILGIFYGPVIALMGGFMVDWIYAMYHGYGLNLMTLSAMMWGFIPGLYFLKVKKVTTVNLTLIIFLTALVAFVINSIQLAIWSGTGISGIYAMLPPRTITLLVKLPIQVYVVKKLHYVLVTYVNQSEVVEE